MVIRDTNNRSYHPLLAAWSSGDDVAKPADDQNDEEEEEEGEDHNEKKEEGVNVEGNDDAALRRPRLKRWKVALRHGVQSIYIYGNVILFFNLILCLCCFEMKSLILI